MNLFSLRYFITLAEVKHYTKAAAQLCITQPSLSHAIAQLEQELGVPLFEKSGRNTTLTQYGEEFLLCAKRTLATLDSGIDSLQRSAQGEGLIRLGLLRTLGTDFVPRLAAEFLALHPHRDIRFSFHSGATTPLLDDLKDQRIDLAFCSKPEPNSPFVWRPIGQEDLVLITPLQHPLAKHRSVCLKDTLPYPHVFFSEGSGMRSVVNDLYSPLGELPPVACETEEDEVIAGLVAHGFGIAIVPYMDLLRRLPVVILTLKELPFTRSFYLVRNQSAYLSPAAENFWEFVLDKQGASDLSK